jgi:hypothetical protein
MATHQASFVIRFVVRDDWSLEQINRGDAPRYRGWLLGDRTVQAHDEAMPWMLATVDLGHRLLPGDFITLTVNREVDAEVVQIGPVTATPRRSDDV